MTVTLAFSAGPIRNTEILPRELDWNALVDALTHPKVGDKDGTYFTRGPAPTNKRTNESIPYADIVILDGDSRIIQETGEIEKGAPPPALVSDALRDAGIDHIIYTTHSHAPPLNKYRVVIPSDRHKPEDVTDCVEYLIEQLHTRGVYLANVSENMAWGQGWFLPRLSVPDAPFETYVWNGGLSLDVRTALAWGEENRRIKRAMEAPMVKTPSVSRRDGSVIEQFNRSANPEWVRYFLEEQGYTFAYKHGDTYRFIRPNSETGTAGVILFKGKYGDWCLYSHHSGQDPLSRKVTDPFGLLCTFQFGGDVRATVRHLEDGRRQEAEKPKLSVQEVEAQVEQITIDEPDPVPVPEPPKAEQPQPEKRERIRLIRADELRKVQVPWLVNKLIPANGLCVMYGKPGTYKSFVALYLSAHVASGLSTLSSRATKQGDVVYIAAEGRGGLHQRFNALQSHYEIPADVPLYFVEASLDLRESDQDYLDLIAAIQKRSAVPRLIVIDTLARTFGGGDENDASEMSQFINTIGNLQEQFGCAVMAIHHSGKDETRGMRGSSALLGAADVVLLLSRDMETSGGTIYVQKMKDGEDGISEEFSVLPWVDPNDPETTSLIVEPGAPEKPQVTGPSSKQDAMDVLRREVARAGRLIEDPSVAGWDVYGISTTEWQDAYCAFEAADGLKDDSAKRKFFRAKSELIKENVVKVYNKMVWINGQAGR
jgi:hypothetical protein